MQIIFNYKTCFVIVLLLGLWQIKTAQAAILQLETAEQTARLGGKLEVAVVFNPESEIVNSLQASILLPVDKLDIVDIYDGGVSPLLWIQKPLFVKMGEFWKVDFSTVAPGGIRGYLFSIITKPTKPGLFFEGNGEGIALLNDGIGTKRDLQILPFSWEVSSELVVVATSTAEIDDRISPEEFNPKIARDKGIFDNQWFVVFHTTDQGLGVKEYEILETAETNSPETQKNWEKVNSPHVLSDQALKKYIFIKAVDKAGNIKIVLAQRPDSQSSDNYAKKIIWGIILTIVLAGAWILIKRRFFPSAHHFYNESSKK